MPNFNLTPPRHFQFPNLPLPSRTHRAEKRDFTEGEEIRRKLDKSAGRHKSGNGQKKSVRVPGKQAQMDHTGKTNY